MGFNQDRKTIDVAGRYTTFYKRNIERVDAGPAGHRHRDAGWYLCKRGDDLS